MKKFYAIVAATLMSVSMFAAKAPTAADLAKVYDVKNNVVLCIEFIEDAVVCNDVRFVGTSNGWGVGIDAPEGTPNSWDNCEKFMPVAGFDGWYAAELAYSEGFEGKPLQEPKDRSWTWDFQCGDKDAWVYVAGLEWRDKGDAYAGEINIAYDAPGAYIYQLKYWKNHKSPCVEAKPHDYKITLYAPENECDIKPGIIGDFNGWKVPVAMAEDMDDDMNTIYTYSFNDVEGHGFKILAAGEEADWSTQVQKYDEENDSWGDLDNYELGEEANVVLQWGNPEEYRFGSCSNEETVSVFVSMKAPAGAPAEGIEIIGTFDSWAGTAMTLKDGAWQAIVDATASQFFKFRSAGTWNTQILVLTPAEEEGAEAEWKEFGDGDLTFGKLWVDGEGAQAGYQVIDLDFSDAAKYKWKETEGIEEIVLTEQAQKVVVDGVLYIVRDNKLFNVQGAQVR